MGERPPLAGATDPDVSEAAIETLTFGKSGRISIAAGVAAGGDGRRRRP